MQKSHGVVDTAMLRYRFHMLWWIRLRSGTEFTWCDENGYTQVQNSYGVVDTVHSGIEFTWCGGYGYAQV